LAAHRLQERRCFSLRLDQLLSRRELVLQIGDLGPQPCQLSLGRISLGARTTRTHCFQRALVALVAPRRDQRRVQALPAHDLAPLSLGVSRVKLGEDLQLVLRRIRLASRSHLRIRVLRGHSLNGSDRHSSHSFLALLTESALISGHPYYDREGWNGPTRLPSCCGASTGRPAWATPRSPAFAAMRSPEARRRCARSTPRSLRSRPRGAGR